ncbi:MAG TPA: ATP synthase subunit I [Methylophilaceae bacterium]|nr:ATP synthase subunit I [Methylophilaceae bacterium]
MSDTPTLHRAFGKAVRWQIIVTLLLAAVAFVLADVHVSLSILGGGAAVMLGGFAAIALARKQPETAGSALLLLLKAEVLKILVIALVLLAIFKLYEQLVPLALIGGLACAALISGAALRTLDQE